MAKNTRDQYFQEAQQRYLKFILQEESQEHKVRDRILEEKTLQKQKRRAQKQLSNVATLGEKESPERTSLTMDRYVNTNYKVQTVILDSAFRDAQVYPLANDFVIKLVQPLKNVFAIRLIKTEYFQPSTCTNYFVFNNIRVPIQAYTMEHAYLYLNGYENTLLANDSSTQFFGRIGPGTEIYPSQASTVTQDPHTYIFTPIEQKLRRFHVKLMQADRSAYTVDQSTRVVLTIAVYCINV